MNSNILIIKKIFFGFTTCVIFKFYWSNMLLHQLQGPIFNFPEADNVYWLLLVAGIPQFLVKNETISLTYDCLLILSSLLCLFIERSRVWPFLFSILFFLYFVTINNFQAYHSHNLIGILMMSILFWFSERLFFPLFSFLRYYLLFIFTSAGIWKIARGSIFMQENMSNLLKKQHFLMLVEKDGSFYSSFINFFISHSVLSQTIFILATILEVSFVVGFFTKRFDTILALVFVVFFVVNYLLNQLYFFEFHILIVLLLPWMKLTRFFDFFGLRAVLAKSE